MSHRLTRLSSLTVAGVVALVALVSDAARAQREQLSELRVLNKVVLLVKEQYVEPSRIQPREMLRAALDAVEKNGPEVLVEDVDATNLKVAIGTASVGTSFVLATVSVKLPLACAPAASAAVTLISTRPTSPLAGVPLKVRVVASKASQVGSGEPSARVAV